MNIVRKYLPLSIALIGLVGVVIGGTFAGIGIRTHNWLQQAMREEHITLGIETELMEAGAVIDTAAAAQIAGDIVRSHRHAIAPTYGDLLGGGYFNPTDPQQLVYAQALNLENYLYLAVASFGLTTIATYAGIFMIVTGIALILIGLLIYRLRLERFGTGQ